jgi:Hemerythrin HHE cation binding domain
MKLLKRTVGTTTSDATQRRDVDAMALLARDHDFIKRLFRQYDALVTQQADGDSRAELAGHICGALAMHAQIEEEIFYPAVQGTWTHTALREHAGCAELIAALDEMGPTATDFDAVVATLSAYIVPHMEAEETELFAQARERGIDADALGRRMFDRLVELRQDVTLIARSSHSTKGAR